MKRSFTLLEIIIVLVILGIVASIGSEVVFRIYENYLLSQRLDQAQYSVEIAIDEIAKRLEKRIPGSAVITDDSLSIVDSIEIEHTQPNQEIVQWVGKAYESFRGEWNGSFYTPGWSGIIDLNSSDRTKVHTPGSTLSYAEDIIYALSGGDVNLSQDSCGAILVPHFENNYSAYGWKSGSAGGFVYPIHREGNTTFVFDDATSSKHISELYNLAWSAYAIVPENKNDGKFDLRLYYNFRPWQGDRFVGGKSSILARNITSFKVHKTNKIIEIYLCANTPLGDQNVTACARRIIF